ncbi:rod shape determining protein RodA [Andreprevotia lacus DSM 23236]|jgi:rod shape determining protein RodA|uniref:Peptidoglycan glycosyltransferase MrdB n=1 Tax=Andreprevotia lacus DSM 23236 TaxID=1121001 RepID=A0A1W1X3F2_9NEIS|nr:rod shape-determining protein RodA [Andreprevotia lacus]SMC18469.1 rod shape determining protein RodA [Andreprevotia lacus DSM 23236]
MIKRIWEGIKRPVDPWLLFFTLLVLVLSVVVLYSASNRDMDKVSDKLTFMGIAIVAMWCVANISLQNLMRLALPAYVLGVLLLLGVQFFGVTSHGATRWLNVGITRIQPSELMRIALPLMLAWYFHHFEAHLNWRHFVVAALLMLIPVGLILKQPDLGTALLIAASGFYILFFAGLPWWLIGAMALAGGGMAYTVTHWNLCIHLLREYQCQRVATMLDPMEDPLGAGYHIIQGTIAIGSGGLLGKGWLNGTQTHLDFIPERTTDFIFAVFGEEFGLAGNAVLLVMYLLVIGRGLTIAMNASTLFGRLLAGSITLTFFTYAFVNMGMVSGILPVVGVPLPLVSYGGTSMLSILTGFGILMSIGRDRKLMKA